jgi:hypothetical protein
LVEGLVHEVLHDTSRYGDIPNSRRRNGKRKTRAGYLPNPEIFREDR